MQYRVRDEHRITTKTGRLKEKRKRAPTASGLSKHCFGLRGLLGLIQF